MDCKKNCEEVCRGCNGLQHDACGYGGGFCSHCRRKKQYRRLSHKDWTPGGEMDLYELEDAVKAAEKVAAAFPCRHPKVHFISGHGGPDAFRAQLQRVEFEKSDLAFVPIHMNDPGHFCALLWCPRNPTSITYCEPLDAGHHKLPKLLEDWKQIIAPNAVLRRCTSDVRMSNKGYARLCGWCVVNDFLNIKLRGEFLPDAPIPPEGLKTTPLLEGYVRAAIANRGKGRNAGTGVPKGRARARRAVEDRIHFEGLSAADDGGPPNFRTGLLRLRRTANDMEAIQQFSDPLRTLLRCTELRLPTDRTVLKALSFDQRKRHLYVLDSLLSAMLRAPPSIRLESQPAIWIQAIDQLQQERAWRSTGAPYATASTLMGALERLDQYCGLPPIRLAQFSEWRDALRSWEKTALRVLPDVTAVGLEEVKALHSQLSPNARSVLLIAWLHAARVGNVFTVKVKESELRRVDGINAWVITWTAAKTTPKVGAYTTHTAVSPQWLEEISSLGIGRLGDEFLVHPSLERAVVVELRAGLHRLNPKHDLRSLRRGSLTAMAQQGVDLETLLTYSGHRTVDMLLRYLQRGKVVQQRIQKGASAALKSLH
jgi:hypothetical protein